MQTLGDRLKIAMAARGIRSQAELCRKANLRPNTISRWVSGETRNVRSNDLNTVSSVLGIAPEWLRTGEGEMVPQPTLEEGLEAIQKAFETREDDSGSESDPRVTLTMATGSGKTTALSIPLLKAAIALAETRVGLSIDQRAEYIANIYAALQDGKDLNILISKNNPT